MVTIRPFTDTPLDYVGYAAILSTLPILVLPTNTKRLV
jgi:hypothetical protein